MLTREFGLRDAEIGGGDGRTLVLACVPFGVEAVVDDGDGPYREVFRRGAFEHVTRAPNRVELRYRHRQDMLPFGFAADLVEDPKHLIGSFRVAPGERGDQILDLVRDGQLSGVSIGFLPGTDMVTGSGAVERVRVKKLGEVSLTPVQVYTGAEVLAVREAMADMAGAVERERLSLRRIRLALR